MSLNLDESTISRIKNWLTSTRNRIRQLEKEANTWKQKHEASEKKYELLVDHLNMLHRRAACGELDGHTVTRSLLEHVK